MRKTGQIEKYDKHIDGVYGKSKTSDSHSLEYLLASMKVEDAVENLNAALDVLEFEKLDFGQLIQRDIDHERVNKKIIDNYLKKGKGKVVFFPPLVVALVEVKEGVPVDKYPGSKVAIEENYKGWGKFALKKWGNLFQLAFMIENEYTGWNIQVKDNAGNTNNVNFANYNVSLDYVMRNIRLIVVDGQHRLKALQLLYEKDKELLKDMNIPICIFMPSEDTDNVDQNEHGTVIKDMRELFVTINTEAQKVSGHFRDLLNDKKISCECIRALADNWKKESDGRYMTKSRLHLLEWNQRDDKKAYQRTIPYSITTVSILVEILDKIFNDMGVALLLDLGARKSELEKTEDECIDVIGNESFELGQMDIIREQIDKLLVPSLDILLRTPIPYQAIETVLNKKLEELSKKKDMIGMKPFLSRLFEFRAGYPGKDLDESIDIEKKFDRDIKSEIESQNQYYFTNVFQYGYICFWGHLCKLLMPKFGLTLKDVADILVTGLNEFCFLSKNEVFSYKSGFTQDMLFNGQKIIVNPNSKKACKNLIAISILGKESMKAIKSKIDADIKDNFIAAIEKLSRTAFEEFKNSLWRRRRDILVKNWENDETLEESVKNKLMNSSGDQKKIKEICWDAVVNEVKKHLSQLENKLGMELKKVE